MKISQAMNIIRVDRIRKSVQTRGVSFLDKIFTPSEQAYCESRRKKYEHYAARLAAKEAVLKALRTAGRGKCSLREIEIARKETGKPVVKLAPRVKKKLGLPARAQIEISMSHESERAAAAAVLWQSRAR